MGMGLTERRVILCLGPERNFGLSDCGCNSIFERRNAAATSVRYALFRQQFVGEISAYSRSIAWRPDFVRSRRTSREGGRLGDKILAESILAGGWHVVRRMVRFRRGAVPHKQAEAISRRAGHTATVVPLRHNLVKGTYH